MSFTNFNQTSNQTTCFSADERAAAIIPQLVIGTTVGAIAIVVPFAVFELSRFRLRCFAAVAAASAVVNLIVAVNTMERIGAGGDDYLEWPWACPSFWVFLLPTVVYNVFGGVLAPAGAVARTYDRHKDSANATTEVEIKWERPITEADYIIHDGRRFRPVEEERERLEDFLLDHTIRLLRIAWLSSMPDGFILQP
jgi:hypothetical protein